MAAWTINARNRKAAKLSLINNNQRTTCSCLLPTAYVLSAPVGPAQLNRPDDIALIRRLLNNFIKLGLLPNSTLLNETGHWDNTMAAALKTIENSYFYGSADPNNKLENNDTLFNFLCNADSTQKEVASTLSAESYQLAAAMVPGGADWTKRLVIKTTVTVNGKPKVKKQIQSELVRGNIRIYLPLILEVVRRI